MAVDSKRMQRHAIAACRADGKEACEPTRSELMKRTAILVCAVASMWPTGSVLASAVADIAPIAATTPLGKSIAATPSGIDSAEATSYAVREKANPELAEFRGGHGAGVYVGGSAMMVVMLVVLLVILL